MFFVVATYFQKRNNVFLPLVLEAKEIEYK